MTATLELLPKKQIQILYWLKNEILWRCLKCLNDPLRKANFIVLKLNTSGYQIRRWKFGDAHLMAFAACNTGFLNFKL